MLKVENLNCGYDNIAVLNNISFQVKRGENICIVGPNGCGKSTLLKAIASILDYKGNITLDLEKISKKDRKKLATKIALMSQNSSVYFSYSVYDTVMLGRYAHINGVFGKPGKYDREKVNEALENVGMLHLKDSLITELSGGQLQRVYLARAFAQNPEVILLDEPTNHLDLRSQIEILAYLKEWAKKENKIVIAVLHDLNLVQAFGENVLLLDKGEIIKNGKPNDVLGCCELQLVYGIDIKEIMLKIL